MKNEIRKLAISERARVESPDQKSSRIMSKLFELPEFINAKTVLFYMSKGTEVSTHMMVSRAAAGKKVVLPVTVGSELKLAELDDVGALVPGAFGVLEPKGRRIEPGKVDLAVVPGVAFDRSGARIGYGKGYYDCLLSKLKCPKIALAYSSQIIQCIPIEPHDVCVDYIVTEKEVIPCQKREKRL